MRFPPTARRLATIVIGFSLAAAACGGGSDAAPNSTTASDTDTSVSAPAPASVPAATDLSPQVDAFLDDLGETEFSGVIRIDQGGSTTTRAFGVADRSNGTPVDPNTVFDIGSITKQFTGAAILRLEMDGKLSVDDQLGDHLPGLGADKADITLHQLLTHTAGLPGGLGDDYEPVDRDGIVALVTQVPLLSEPGSTFEYSNTGYSLLAVVIESVTGESYETYLREALFEPAGMVNTGYVVPRWDGMTIAVGYDAASGDEQGRPNELPWDDDGPYWHLRGNGGILSTAEDMFKWHEALLGGDILDAEAKEKLYGKHVSEGPGAPTFYGYGWAIFPTPLDTTLITHNGGNGIFFADFLRFLDDDLTIYLATNSATEENEAVAFRVADLILGTDFAAQMGGSDDLCGFSQWGPDTLPPGPDLDELPPTEVGTTMAEFLSILPGSDDDARLRFAIDHVDPTLSGGASPEAVAGEIASLQAEFEGFELIRMLQSGPEWFHFLMESPDDVVLLSLGSTEATPTLVACLEVVYL